MRGLRKFNIVACLIVGLYVLVRVNPITTFELIFLLGILFHCGMMFRKLGRFRRRPAAEESQPQNQSLTYWQTLVVTFCSALQVCCVAWLLMILRFRCVFQDLIIANPYFPVITTLEFVIPWLWLLVYAAVLILTSWKPRATLVLMVMGCVLTIVIPFFYPKVKLSQPYILRSLGFEQTPKLLRNAKTNYETKPFQIERDVNLKLLLDQARLTNYRPSRQWYDALMSFEPRYWHRFRELGEQEPEVHSLFDECVRRRFGISKDLEPEQAWEILIKISDEAKANGRYFLQSSIADGEYSPEFVYSCNQRAVELLAPHLNLTQLIEFLKAEIQRGNWPKTIVSKRTPFPPKFPFRDKDDVAALEIRPVIHAAWHIDRELNAKYPNEYNRIEKELGDVLFAKFPPRPSQWSLSDVMTLFDQGNEELSSSMKSMIRAGYLRFNRFRPPVFGSPDADEYVRRHASGGLAKFTTKTLGNENWLSRIAIATGLALPAGEKQQLGSAHTDHWYQELLMLDSPVGNEYRESHRAELVDLANRSLKPVPKKPRSKKDRDDSVALGALNSIFGGNIFGGNNSSTDAPIPQHLEFLVLDSPSDKVAETSLGMEFLPELYSRLNELPEMKENIRLILRWNYLARLWPECGVEPFVNSYFETNSRWRQVALLGTHGERWLPESLPVECRMEILSRILAKAETQNGAETEGTFLLQGKTENELESIKRAIAVLDCPLAGATFVELNAGKFAEGGRLNPGEPPFDEEKMKRLQRQIGEYRPYRRKSAAGVKPMDFLYRGDRINAFAQHSNPDIRMIAIAVIRDRPIPKHLPLLDSLAQDSNDEVKRWALKALKELNTIRDTPPTGKN